MIKGIDVSMYQGSIDFNKVKAAGVDFVIIRCNNWDNRVNGVVKDPYFEQNYSRAKAAGLNVGVYYFTWETTAEGAKRDAAMCLSFIKGKQFEYPIYFDLEWQKAFAKGRTVCSAMVETFCDALEKAGYYAGLYISRSPLQDYITSSVANRYALWIAEYASKCNYEGTYGMWQYSSKGRINGISGDVDLDYSHVDYPTAIKSCGLNGYTKTTNTTTSTKTTTTVKKKTVTEIAQEVIDGKWGNGDTRKSKLKAAGYDYTMVQKKVNELLAKKKSIDQVAKEVIQGKWGNGTDRVRRLTTAGYDYNTIQKRVNQLMKK